MTDSRYVLAAGDADFAQAVLERSREVPVVVDFWAPWCGPCRNLGPLLERLTEEHGGAFLLVKVDVDQSPAVAERYGVRSIPLVLGFRDGEVVAEFTGAQPEAAIRTFLERVLPSRADALVAEAAELAEGGHENAAEERLVEALDADPRHAPAHVALARLRGAQGRPAEALELLERVVADGPLAREIDQLAAELRMREHSGGSDLAGLRTAADARPDDLDARLALGQGLASAHQFEEALGELLEIVRRDPDFAEQAARKAMFDVFEVLGSDDPLTERFRGELARALFR